MENGLEIASFIVNVIGAILIPLSIFFLGRINDKKISNLNIEKYAKEFIIENAEEIDFLPFCVVSNAYDWQYKNKRKIYNRFNALTKDIQNEILRLRRYDYTVLSSNSWIRQGIETIEKFATKYDLGQHFLHDNAKYFKYSITRHNDDISKFNEFEKLFDDNIAFYKDKTTKISSANKLTFMQYFWNYCEIFVQNINPDNVKKEDFIRPLDYLAIVKNFYGGDSVQMSFWILVMIKTISSYIVQKKYVSLCKVKIKGEIKTDSCYPTKMEDLFYETLTYLYTMYLYEKQYKKDFSDFDK